MPVDAQQAVAEAFLQLHIAAALPINVPTSRYTQQLL